MRHGGAHEGVDERRLAASTIDDFSVEVASAVKVFGGAVPATVFELVFALGDGLFGSFGHGDDDARMVADQSPLLPPQRRVHVWIQIRVGDRVLFYRVRHQIVRLSRSGNSPPFATSPSSFGFAQVRQHHHQDQNEEDASVHRIQQRWFFADNSLTV